MKILDLADAADLVARADFIRKDGGRWKKTGARLSKGLHQCAIIEFAHQTWRQTLIIQPAIDKAANRGVGSGLC